MTVNGAVWHFFFLYLKMAERDVSPASCFYVKLSRLPLSLSFNDLRWSWSCADREGQLQILLTKHNKTQNCVLFSPICYKHPNMFIKVKQNWKKMFHKCKIMKYGNKETFSETQLTQKLCFCLSWNNFVIWCWDDDFVTSFFLRFSRLFCLHERFMFVSVHFISFCCELGTSPERQASFTPEGKVIIVFFCVLHKRCCFTLTKRLMIKIITVIICILACVAPDALECHYFFFLSYLHFFL